jgi:hypothetical protein
MMRRVISVRSLARLLWTSMLVTAAISVPTPASAGKPSRCPPGGVFSGGGCYIPVTTIISDVDANGLPADIQSDGLGSYRHGVNNVSSLLTDNGYNRLKWDWQFDLYLNSSSRLVNHSFDPRTRSRPATLTTPRRPILRSGEACR